MATLIVLAGIVLIEAGKATSSSRISWNGRAEEPWARSGSWRSGKIQRDRAGALPELAAGAFSL